jgi:hypothetical protein
MAHYSHDVRPVLSNTYPDRWIGRGGPSTWLPRSPDLNHFDFYLWGHIDTLAHAALADNEEALHRRTVNVCQTIRVYPGISEQMRRPMMRRVEACVEPHKYFHVSEGCVTNKMSFGFNDRIYWTFIQLVRTAHRSLSDTLSSSFDWTLRWNCPNYQLNCQFRFKVKVMLRPAVQSASSSRNKAPIWGLRPDIYYC